MLYLEPHPQNRVHALEGERLTFPMFFLCSGNGLVSYYIHLILEGVGVKSPATQGAINCGLQVWKPPRVFNALH